MSPSRCGQGEEEEEGWGREGFAASWARLLLLGPSPPWCPSLSPWGAGGGTRQGWDEPGSVILMATGLGQHLLWRLCCLSPCPRRMSLAPSSRRDGSHGVGDEVR